MTVVIIGILYALTVLYLIKNNNINKLEANNSKLLFICKSTLKGFILYTIAGCLLASVILFFLIYKNGEPHSHSMPELLYIWLGAAGAITGCILGIFLSILNTSSINKKLIVGSLLFVIGSFIWLELL
ncbi:MAG: hypothetical protein ACSHW4_13245 [Cellulophaga sp.]